MKIKGLVLSLLVIVSSAAFANEGDPSVAVVAFKGSEVYKVIYKGGAGKVRMNILDAQGKKIHSSTIDAEDGFILPVNFKGLSAGTYTIEILDDAGKYTQQVVYKPASALHAVHVSKLQNADDKFLLALANLQNEAIKVTIYDAAQRVVYHESKVLSGDFAQVYKIEHPSNSYTFEVSDSSGNSKSFKF